MENVSQTIIDKQYQTGIQLISYLNGKNELTLLNEAENNFRKNILLSAASYFEKEISDLIIEFAKIYSKNNELLIAIVNQKAVKRQYFTYFDWDRATNANSFFALFGENFKSTISKIVKQRSDIDDSIKSFLQLGQERNKLVHQNYAEVVLDKTAHEIYSLYQSGLIFIAFIKIELGLNKENRISDIDTKDKYVKNSIITTRKLAFIKRAKYKLPKSTKHSRFK